MPAGSNLRYFWLHSEIPLWKPCFMRIDQISWELKWLSPKNCVANMLYCRDLVFKPCLFWKATVVNWTQIIYYLDLMIKWINNCSGLVKSLWQVSAQCLSWLNFKLKRCRVSSKLKHYILSDLWSHPSKFEFFWSLRIFSIIYILFFFLSFGVLKWTICQNLTARGLESKHDFAFLMIIQKWFIWEQKLVKYTKKSFLKLFCRWNNWRSDSHFEFKKQMLNFWARRSFELWNFS